MIKKRNRRVPPEIPTASMADIAFLLIVFFLVTTTMYQDKGLSLTLPEVGETKQVQQKNILNIWINDDDQVALFDPGPPETLTPVDLGNIGDQVKSRLSTNDKLIVSLKAERGSSYRMFVDVLDELQLAGANKISIANPEETR